MAGEILEGEPVERIVRHRVKWPHKDKSNDAGQDCSYTVTKTKIRITDLSLKRCANKVARENSQTHDQMT